MKQSLCILSLFLITCSAKAQTVSFSPYSVGQLNGTVKATVEYNDFGLVGTYATKTLYNVQKDGIKSKYSGTHLGMFYKPLKYEIRGFKVKGGVGIWKDRFPTHEGDHVNFTAELSYKIGQNISITYDHYSNGFGIVNSFNPGLDSFGISIHF